jgi:hypothetical protein
LIGEGALEAGIGVLGIAGQVFGGVGLFDSGAAFGFVGGGFVAGEPIRGPYSTPEVHPGDPAAVSGAYAGIGSGLFLTNADSASELRGYFEAFNVNTPLFSVQFAWSGAIWSGSLTFGGGAGVSASEYPTYTYAEDSCF